MAFSRSTPVGRPASRSTTPPSMSPLSAVMPQAVRAAEFRATTWWQRRQRMAGVDTQSRSSLAVATFPQGLWLSGLCLPVPLTRNMLIGWSALPSMNKALILKRGKPCGKAGDDASAQPPSLFQSVGIVSA